MAEKWEVELLKHAGENRVDFTAVDKEIKSLKHRMDSGEEQTKTIQSLVVSVKELALNMKNMFEIQTKMNERIEELESKPSKRWELIISNLISVLVGGSVSFFLAKITQV